jgi:hypothetical protein
MFKKKKSAETDPYRTSLRSLPERQNVYTYYKSRSFKEEPARQSLSGLGEKHVIQQKEKHFSVQRNVKVGIVVVILLVLFALDIRLSTSVNVQITGTTRVSGIYMHPTALYQSEVDKLTNVSFGNKFKITINTSKIESGMLQQFPELANVSIKVPLIGSKITVVVSPVLPAIILNDQKNQHFLVGPYGKTLRAVMPDSLADFSIPIVNDQTALQAQIGKSVITQSDTNFILTVSAQFQAHQIKIQSMTLPITSRELDVYLVGLPYYVKFNLADYVSINQQIGTYFATRNYLIKNNIIPTQYIDARSQGRVFYK